MSIVHRLNLNKHIKDVQNLSLVNAENIKISIDQSCITNEESLVSTDIVNNSLKQYYSTAYKIYSIIPCNEELVIIASDVDDKLDIFRYREKDNVFKLAYGGYTDGMPNNRLSYNGGEIKGTFTYNVENCLILAISEYNCKNKNIPLRVINLGNIDDDSIYSDKELDESKLFIVPEVKLPSISKYTYVKGTSYKGWYYFYIRYKIDEINYTQWYSFGFPIYNDTLENQVITKYCYNRDSKLKSVDNSDTNYYKIYCPTDASDTGYNVGCSDYFSNQLDTCEETIELSLINLDNSYKQFQLGIVIFNKSKNYIYRTSDINCDNNIYKYIINISSLVDCTVNELITSYYNYFDVKNIVNYNNRLYISNYKELNLNKDIDENIINNITVGLDFSKEINDKGTVYDNAIYKGDPIGAQYDSFSRRISMSEYLHIDDEEKIKIELIASDGTITEEVTDKAKFFIIIPALSEIYNYTGYISILHITRLENDIIEEYKSYTSLFTDNGFKISSVNNLFEPSYITIDRIINGLGKQYINTNTSFKDRKENTTLIPGEVYNFFIHFVDKYGHATNGYRIPNNTKWSIFNNNDRPEIIPVVFYATINGENNKYYAACPIDNNVSKRVNNKYEIDTTNINFYTNYNPTTKLLTDNVNIDILEDIEVAFKEYFYSFANKENLETKWYQIAITVADDNLSCGFNLYINSNGERLFKVPFPNNYDAVSNDYLIMKPDKNENGEDISSLFSYFTYNRYNKFKLLHPIFNNITIPDEYIGYFISYEKLEPIQRQTGLLTKNDFRSKDLIGDIRGPINVGEYGEVYFVETLDMAELSTANSQNSDNIYFYSGNYDISDSIKLDYNVFRIEGINIFTDDDITYYDFYQRNQGYKYPHSLNKIQIEPHSSIKTYFLQDYKLCVADSVKDNRIGLGTTLSIKNNYSIFPEYTNLYNTVEAGIFYKAFKLYGNNIKLFRVTLINNSRNIYLSKNKTLIRLGNIQYKTDDNIQNYTIHSGLNGNYTFDGCLIYENAGFQFNSADKTIRRNNSDTLYYPTEVNEQIHTRFNDCPFLCYLQFPICTNVYYESKCYNNEPATQVFNMRYSSGENAEQKASMFWYGCIVEPKNSIDLFQNKQGASEDFNPTTYSNYNEELLSISEYNKTIRRSNVIQDESRINNWRVFPIEAYKNITENKGIITNIIGIGINFLVHTEHSLFMFDMNNVLKTNNTDVQMLQPDLLDVNYREIFTSDLGFAGLQNNNSYIVDQFGYIFYDNSSNKLYRFDNNTLAKIDEDITEWLFKYKPYNVIFANDKINDRLIIKFDYIINDTKNTKLISYNYKLQKFISFHTYNYDIAYNTKNKLYMLYNNKLFNFIDDNSKYGSNNIHGSQENMISYISIIINSEYDAIKYLEYITYKLRKYITNVNIDNTKFPVEETSVPFSGDSIRIFNDEVDTGILNINVNKEENKNVFGEYDKPFWQLGNWNFNYMRNNLSEGNSNANKLSRIYGNFFVIQFIFYNNDNKKIEFETLNYKIIK